MVLLFGAVFIILDYICIYVCGQQAIGISKV